MASHSYLMKRFGIKWVMIRLVLGIVLPLAGVCFLGLYYGRETLLSIASQNAKAITAQRGINLSSWISERKEDVISHAEKLEEMQFEKAFLGEDLSAQEKKRTEIMRLFETEVVREAEEEGGVQSLAIVDARSRTILAEYPERTDLDSSLINKISTESGASTLLLSYFDTHSNNFRFFISSPFPSHSTDMLFLVEVKSGGLKDVVSGKGGEEGLGYTYLADKNGRILMGAGNAHAMREPSSALVSEIIRKHEKELTGLYLSSTLGNTIMIISYTTLPSGWILFTEIPQDQIFGIINWWILGLILIVFSLLVTLVAIFNLRSLVVPLRMSIDQISQAGTSLSVTSQQVAASAQNNAAIAEQVAQGAVTQSAQAETISRSIAEIAQGAQEMIASSEEAARVARTVSQVTQTAGEKGEQSQHSLDQIKKMATDTAVIARTMGNRSREIRTIVETITKIAEQTNLLSLNAAIEAARAGEAGRGFSVVADEIRKLAEQSGNAAEEIKSQVEKMLVQISDTVLAAEKGLEHADQNAVVVNQSLQELQNISGSIQQLSARIKEISTHTEKQSQLVQHVAESMDAIAGVAEQNASGAEQLSASTQQQSAANQQVAAASQQLQALALELQRITGGFHLGLQNQEIALSHERLTKKPITAYVLEEKPEGKNDAGGSGA